MRQVTMVCRRSIEVGAICVNAHVRGKGERGNTLTYRDPVDPFGFVILVIVIFD